MGALQVVSNFQSKDEVELLQSFNTGAVQASVDKIDELVAGYSSDLAAMKEVSALMTTPAAASVMQYFNEAQWNERYGNTTSIGSSHFAFAEAKAALDAQYWDRALKLTNVLDLMPQKRRTEWWEVIKKRQAPEFSEAAVRTTLADFLGNTLTYFAERVDGIFQALSKSHITNMPQGFSARLIIEKVMDSDWSLNSNKGGYINDLRCVVARLMGREEPKYGICSSLIAGLSDHFGEWRVVDGGALRCKLFKNGNVHIEVGPDIAWQLNAVLATLYPLAIPSQFRAKPKKVQKEFELLGKPLPFNVLNALSQLKMKSFDDVRRFSDNPFSFVVPFNLDNECGKALKEVLEMLGGVPHYVNRFCWYEFEYDAQAVIREVVISGCIPDHVSHQYYPTKETLARMAVDLADIQPGEEVCEPEAGLGGIAQYIPADQLTCVEVSPLHCRVLEAKGFHTINADFLKWSQTAPKFDKIVSNPPFSKGRAVLHMQASASLIAEGGRLVGILPGSLRGKNDMLGEGWSIHWEGPFHDQFDGTGVTVCIMVADRLED
ncbi:DUF4942 domain-containing protein [Pseudomonas aeruginosa]|uniref:DUF4942 domain-containing protein n=1 Tax=Pseudomonas aeruginosa TaxID=287 RepID=UPI001ADA6AAD|nr:DUF4942 domain-containing protein [Pseudomonas aeruginosa]MBO8337033.1 DUF4942 domain-containing protein [Pseudomonas aeruginosa]HCF4080922.1 DUF4942 domain-containing protein [Pseudomonas aeruginosa]